MPVPMSDWWARWPEKGAGLLVTQFQESPPALPSTAPAGVASSTQAVLTVTLGAGVLVLVTGGGVLVMVMGGGSLVTVTGGGVLVSVTGGGVLVIAKVVVPARSQVARPP